MPLSYLLSVYQSLKMAENMKQESLSWFVVTHLLYTNGLEGWMIEFSMNARPLLLGQSLHAGPALHSFTYSLVKKSLIEEEAADSGNHQLLGWAE